MNLYFDIETVPTDNETIIERVASKVKAPGNYKKPETIQKWMDENMESEIEKGLHKTGLSGTFGQILMIGFAIDDNPVQVVSRDLKGSEQSVLKAFFHQVHLAIGENHKPVTWIGHNIQKFDLRFIKQRAIVTGAKPPFYIPADEPVYSDKMFDTMYKWAGFGGTVSQDDLCLALGIPTKPGMTGADVWAYAKAGRYDEIEAYCEHDVESVRRIFNKMNFK